MFGTIVLVILLVALIGTAAIFGGLYAKCRSSKKNLDSLYNRYDEARANVKSCKSDLKDAKSSLSKCNDRHDSLKSKYDKLKDDVKNLQSAVDKCKSQSSSSSSSSSSGSGSDYCLGLTFAPLGKLVRGAEVMDELQTLFKSVSDFACSDANMKFIDGVLKDIREEIRSEDKISCDDLYDEMKKEMTDLVEMAGPGSKDSALKAQALARSILHASCDQESGQIDPDLWYEMAKNVLESLCK